MITDELRKWTPQINGYKLLRPCDEKELAAIADRIDAKHERLMQEQPCTIDMVPITDENMERHGWVRLPVDADGVPIHVGDELTWLDEEVSHKVTCITLESDGGWWVFASGYGKRPDKLRHYHKPTVEDVLREMHEKLDEVTALYVGEAIDSDERDHDEARIFAEYAARLREMLRGDA